MSIPAPVQNEIFFFLKEEDARWRRFNRGINDEKMKSDRLKKLEYKKEGKNAIKGK